MASPWKRFAFGSAAARNVGTGPNDVAAGDHTHAGSASWGGIGGTLSDQADLQNALNGKSSTSHAHSYNDLTDKPTLGDSAAKNVGTGAGDVAAGNHTHPGGSEAFPVGSVFIAVVSTNPGTLLGYGTWSAFGAGRMLVGFDSGDTDFDTVEETGGAKTVTLAEAQMPSHTHVQNSHNHTQDAHTHTQNAHTHVLTELRDATTGGATTNIALTADTSSTLGTKTTGSTTATNQNAIATNQAATATNQNTGGGEAHNNLPPYIVVHLWKRIS